MKREPPWTCMWTGLHFVPDARTLTRCQRDLGPGEVVTLERHEPVSQASRGHYHACLYEAWSQLPPKEARRFPTVEHLRAWALIQAGYYNEKTCVSPDHKQALVYAAFVRKFTDYAVIIVKKNVVCVYEAKSQSGRAMGKKDFNASKQAVLEIAAGLIGVSSEDLANNAGKAA